MFLGTRHERSLLVWEGPKCKRDPGDSCPLHLPAPTLLSFFNRLFMWRKDGTRWLQAGMVLVISKLDKRIVCPWSATRSQERSTGLVLNPS